MTSTTVVACRDARGAHWRLGSLPPPEGRILLVGWHQVPEALDAGIPAQVASVLAHALTAIARVSFPSSSVGRAGPAWSAFGEDLACALAPGGLAARVGARLKGIPTDIGLISTRRPETAQRIFEDADYPWSLQGQVALLSEPDATPPSIGRETLLALFEDDWAGQTKRLAAAGVEGVLRPGVDGDVAGLLCVSEGLEQVFLAALEGEARRAGLGWALVPESAFPSL